MVLGDLGAFDDARVAFECSLTLARELDDPLRIGSALNNLGNLAVFDGGYDRADALFGEAVDLYRREARRIASLRDLLLESLAIAEDLGHRQGVACTIDFAAAHAAARGDAGQRRGCSARQRRSGHPPGARGRPTWRSWSRRPRGWRPVTTRRPRRNGPCRRRRRSRRPAWRLNNGR
jgi:hypothetical protein